MARGQKHETHMKRFIRTAEENALTTLVFFYHEVLEAFSPFGDGSSSEEVNLTVAIHAFDSLRSGRSSRNERRRLQLRERAEGVRATFEEWVRRTLLEYRNGGVWHAGVIPQLLADPEEGTADLALVDRVVGVYRKVVKLYIDSFTPDQYQMVYLSHAFEAADRYQGLRLLGADASECLKTAREVASYVKSWGMLFSY